MKLRGYASARGATPLLTELFMWQSARADHLPGVACCCWLLPQPERKRRRPRRRPAGGSTGRLCQPEDACLQVARRRRTRLSRAKGVLSPLGVRVRVCTCVRARVLTAANLQEISQLRLPAADHGHHSDTTAGRPIPVSLEARARGRLRVGGHRYQPGGCRRTRASQVLSQCGSLG